MAEDKNGGGTPFRPKPRFNAGDKVWNRPLDRMQIVTSRDWVPAAKDWIYTLDEEYVQLEEFLVLKDPSAPMFQSGAARPSTSMRNALEWYANASAAELTRDGGDLAREALNGKV